MLDFTAKPIRKEEWGDVRHQANGLRLSAPARCGQVIVGNFLERGLELLATKDVPAGNGE